MYSRFSIVLLLVLSLSYTAVIAEQPKCNIIYTSRIRRASKFFEHLFALNNGTKLLRLYAPNARLFLPNQPVAIGRRAIAAAWDGAFNNNGFRAVRLTILTLRQARRGTFVEKGTAALTVMRKDGSRTVLNSNYIVVWKIFCGRPLIVRDTVLA